MPISITQQQEQEALERLRKFLRGKAHLSGGYRIPAELACTAAGYDIHEGATFWMVKNVVYVTLESQNTQLGLKFRPEGVELTRRSLGSGLYARN